MKSKAALVSRLLLGLIYFVFGLNGFLQFIPVPPHPPEAGAFLGALGATGYFFPLLKGTETLMGALLLANVAAPAALVVLAPITVHIFLFHAVLTPGAQNSVLPVAMIALHVVAASGHWKLFAPLFKRNAA